MNFLSRLFPLQFFARFVQVSGEVCFCQLADARDTCVYGSAATLRPCAWGTPHSPPYAHIHTAHRHLRNTMFSRITARERTSRKGRSTLSDGAIGKVRRDAGQLLLLWFWRLEEYHKLYLASSDY
jgi:hypothetical protein